MQKSTSNHEKGFENFKGWELRHLANRADQFGLNEEKDLLVRLGWQLAEEEEIDNKKLKKIKATLQRLSEIPRFAVSCRKADCSVCKKIEKLSPNIKVKKPWELSVETYKWQKEAIKEWFKNNGKGIVKVVTGAGKTVFALSLVSKLKNTRVYRKEGLKIIIVVPTTALLDQWYEEICYLLNLNDKDIGVFYGRKKDSIDKFPIMIFVLPSAAKHLYSEVNKLVDNEDIFLIVDECHRSGSPVYSKIYKINFSFGLGLSATPERDGDYAFEEIISPALGPIIYQYDHQQARRDMLIPPYRLKRISVKLKKYEEMRYQEFTDKLRNLHLKLYKKYPQLKGLNSSEFIKKLGAIQNKEDAPLAKRYTILTNMRKEIVHTSDSKMQALIWIINNELTSSMKVLIFHERIKSAEKIFNFLKNKGFSVGIYHSNMSSERRRMNLRQYRNGEKNILITCTALDEGLDVPDTYVGIIVAATSSIRQRIQRIGRILRRAPGKDYSLIYTIYIKNIEEHIYKKSVMQKLEKAAERVEYLRLKV